MGLILVVEDDETNRELLTKFLKRSGHTVIQAVDGREGIQRAQADMPDIILMDLSLPGVDGWEATRRIKNSSKTKHIPIIVLTAHTAADEVKRAMEAGCNGYETKPLVFSRLMNKVRAVAG